VLMFKPLSLAQAKGLANRWLRSRRLIAGGSFPQPGSLFERLMINLDAPSSLIEHRHPVVVERQITRDQIERACRTA